MVIERDVKKMLDMDAYAYSNPWSQKSPDGKALLGLGAILLAMVSQSLWIQGLLILILGFLVVCQAKIPLSYYIKLFRIPVTFLILGMVTMLITLSTTGEELLWSLSLGNIYLGITPSGIPMAGLLLGRCMATLSALYFMALTIPLNQTIRLMKKVRIPVLLIELMVLMYRFIHIFLSSVQESLEALQLRNGFINGKTARKSLALLVVMIYGKMMASYSDWVMVLDTKNYNGNFYV